MANQNGKQKAYEPGTLALFAGLGVFMSILGVVSLLAVVGGVQGMAFEKIKQVMQGLGGSLCIGISVLLIWGGALCMFTAGKNVPSAAISPCWCYFWRCWAFSICSAPSARKG